MSWSIFITTIPSEEISFEEVLSIYGLRWRIENIFKTWKSNMNFSTIHNVSEHQLRTILTVRLAMLVTIYHKVFTPLRYHIRSSFAKDLSLMKLLRYLQINPDRINPLLRICSEPMCNKSLLSAIARYCVYDSRKKRLNYTQVEEEIFALPGLA